MATPSQHRYLLSSKYGEVVDKIIPTELLAHLIQSGVLSIQEAEMVEDTRGGETARARKLVALVDRKSDDQLPVFVQCLRDANHGHVADILEGEGESEVELRLSVRNPEVKNLEDEFSRISCHEPSVPGSLDVTSSERVTGSPAPAPYQCTCRGLEDEIRESMRIANGEMQRCMVQRKFDEWKFYESTINNCISWLQELRKMGCDLCQVKTGCVILRFRCQKQGLDYLWPGVTSGRFSRELMTIFRDLYAEIKGITIQIDVTINPIDNKGGCSDDAGGATAACTDAATEGSISKSKADFDLHVQGIAKRLERIGDEIKSQTDFLDCVDGMQSPNLSPEKNVIRQSVMALKNIIPKCAFITEGYVSGTDEQSWNWAVDALNKFHGWWFQALGSPKTPQTPENMEKFNFVDTKGRKQAAVFLMQLENIVESLEDSVKVEDALKRHLEEKFSDLRCQPLKGKVQVHQASDKPGDSDEVD